MESKNEDEGAPSYQFDFALLSGPDREGSDGCINGSPRSFASSGSGEIGDGKGLPKNKLSRLIVENDWEGALFALSDENDAGSKDDTSNDDGAANGCRAACAPEKGGMLPLHFACREGAPPDLVGALVEAHPAGITARTEEDGWIALHYLAAGREQGSREESNELCHQRAEELLLCSADCMLCRDASNRVSAARILLNSSRSPSAMARTADFDGSLTPLHVACLTEARKDMLGVLLDASPEAASLADDDGNLPLHWIFHPQVSIASVERVMREYPSGTRAINLNGALPLHKACSVGASVEVIRLLLVEFPDGAKAKDKNGNLPLHLIVPKFCRKNEGTKTQSGQFHINNNQKNMVKKRVKNLLQLLEIYPDGVHVKNSHGETPLFRALSEAAPLDIVKPLLDASPHCCFENNRGYENSHCPDVGCNFTVNGATIARAKHSHDASITSPLDVACQYDSPPDVIRALLEINPEQARRIATDGSGGARLPLHAACRTGAATETIGALLEAYPEGASAVEGRDRRRPLHLECMTRCDPNVVGMLLGADGAAAEALDARGRTALHYAAEFVGGSSGGVGDERTAIDALVVAYPDALEVEDYEGHVPRLRETPSSVDDIPLVKANDDEEAAAAGQKRSVRFAL